jgi:hypothetical protein
MSFYDTDFYAWANQQAALLRAGNLSAAEIENIAEEIESMGKTEKRELISRLTVLLLHLLKWQFQPGLRSNSWRLTVKEQRFRLADHLEDNPSLNSGLPEVIAKAYRLALVEAERETGLPETIFPAECSWTFNQMMDDSFWPGA